MRSPESIRRSTRICGCFFLFQAVLSLALSCFYFYSRQWGLASLLFFGVAWCGLIGWAAVFGTIPLLPRMGGEPGSGGAGMEGAGKPAPLRPAPTHHWQAAKDLPPSDRTHTFPKD